MKKVKLRQIEVEILKLLKKKKMHTDIALELNTEYWNVRDTVGKLIRLGMIKRTARGQFEFLIDEYEIIDGKKFDRPRKADLEKTPIPSALESFIRVNYKKMKRGEMARQLGISRYELNKAIIQIGMGS